MNNKYYRIWSDQFEGTVLTGEAYEIVKTQIGNGDPRFHEAKEVVVLDIGDDERVLDVEDVAELGYTPIEELTEQDSDDDFLETLSDGFNETEEDYEVWDELNEEEEKQYFLEYDDIKE